MSVTIDETPSEDDIQWVDDQLTAFNKEQAGRHDFVPVQLVVREDGQIVAGLNGVTGWDWLHVRILWVQESHRSEGLGTQLLHRAEQIACDRGCIGACLSSFCFQAPGFYQKHGYDSFGQIPEYPVGSTLHFLSKSFSAERHS